MANQTVNPVPKPGEQKKQKQQPAPTEQGARVYELLMEIDDLQRALSEKRQELNQIIGDYRYSLRYAE